MKLSETVENTGVDVKKLLALICILFRPEPFYRVSTHCTGVETREKLKIVLGNFRNQILHKNKGKTSHRKLLMSLNLKFVILFCSLIFNCVIFCFIIWIVVQDTKMGFPFLIKLCRKIGTG